MGENDAVTGLHTECETSKYYVLITKINKYINHISIPYWRLNQLNFFQYLFMFLLKI